MYHGSDGTGGGPHCVLAIDVGNFYDRFTPRSKREQPGGCWQTAFMTGNRLDLQIDHPHSTRPLRVENLFVFPG
jgi:hypothetical protein